MTSDNEREFVRITNKDIWNKLLDLEEDMRAISQADLQKRVRQLELRFYGILAGLVGATATFGMVVSRGGV